MLSLRKEFQRICTAFTLILFTHSLRSYRGADFIEAAFLFFWCILSDAALGFKIHVKVVNRLTIWGSRGLG